MKLRPVTKLEKRNKKLSKKIIMLANCDTIFSIYGQFGAIWKSNSVRIVCETFVFNNSNLLSYKK